MAIQFDYANEGRIFVPTYKGRHLRKKFEEHPEYKTRIPKRWLTVGWVEERRQDDTGNSGSDSR